MLRDRLKNSIELLAVLLGFSILNFSCSVIRPRVTRQEEETTRGSDL